MPSPNKVALARVISSMQHKVEPNKLFDVLNRMNADLGKVYEGLFDGPFLAVDGSRITNLNSRALTGPISVYNELPVIPIRETADLPPSGEPSMDGIIVIDSDTESLVFYVNGLRFAAAGVAF